MAASTPTRLEPDAFTSFGDLLRFLRRRAQLTQRELSIAVGYNYAQICRLEQGQRLPDPTIVAAMFVGALDLEDEPAWAARLIELATAARQERNEGALAPAAPMAASPERARHDPRALIPAAAPHEVARMRLVARLHA